MSTKLIDLTELFAEHEVKLRSGKTVKVVPVDAAGYELCLQLRETGDDRLYWKIAGRCLPDLGDDEVAQLSEFEAVAVVQIARGYADRLVAAMQDSAEGNGERVTEAPGSAPSSSSPATLSDTSAPS